MRLVGNDFALAVHVGAGGAEAEHARLRVTPDICVKDADTAAFGCQGCCEVGSQGAFAYAALAGADADDAADLGQCA